jgi:hypothetical protein
MSERCSGHSCTTHAVAEPGTFVSLCAVSSARRGSTHATAAAGSRPLLLPLPSLLLPPPSSEQSEPSMLLSEAHGLLAQLSRDATAVTSAPSMYAQATRMSMRE